MEAQTLQVRRTIRIPWTMLLVVALLAATLALGIGVATSRDDTTTVPGRSGSTIGPKDLSGPTAYPGFVPGGQAPTKVSGHVGTNGGTQSEPGTFTAANGKPLS
jgi:hypothetical protein